MYNSTILTRNSDGKLASACVAEVQDGIILRSNAIQCTGKEGTPEYDAYFRAYYESRNVALGGLNRTLEIVEGTKAYRDFFTGALR